MRPLLVSMIVLLAACRPPAGPHPSPVDPRKADDCERAETALIDLGCSDSQGVMMGGPNRAGVPFRQICRDAVLNHLSLNATCLAELKDCRAVQSCL